jgi:hypothetical protein
MKPENEAAEKQIVITHGRVHRGAPTSGNEDILSPERRSLV